jgi:hypothetical protein
MKPFVALGILLAVFVCLAPATRSSLAFAKTCSDFDSQAAAQAYMSDQPGDPDKLDGNNNGVACDNLPCPCDTVPVDWFVAGTPSSSSSGSTQATPASGSQSGSQSTGPKTVVVSQELYNAVANAVVQHRDPALVYTELSRVVTLPANLTTPVNLITPPSTGDAGLAAGR